MIGFDVYAPCMAKFVAAGGQSAKSPREATKDVKFLICMVANSVQATPLLFDSDTGAIVSMPKHATILMCSTVAPAYIDEITQRLAELGRSDVRLIDCPVSGGAGRAADGTLSIFSSGEDSDLEHANSILESMSSKLYKIPGGLGGGSKAKLIHQVFAGIHIAMASEAMGLAAAAGLNTQEAFEELKESEGGSWMFTHRVPPMLDRSMPPYSAISIIAKDVGIITSTNREARISLPLLSLAEQLYVNAIAAGWEKEDDCAMVRLYLPGRPDLVAQQARSFKSSQSSAVSVDDIKHLMVGVHLAATCEAMEFCRRLRIDANLMFDIVSNAAGNSAAFEKYFSSLQESNYVLGHIRDARGIGKRLVGFPPLTLY